MNNYLRNYFKKIKLKCSHFILKQKNVEGIGKTKTLDINLPTANAR